MKNIKKIIAKNEQEALSIASKEFEAPIEQLKIQEVETIKKGFFRKSTNNYTVEFKKKIKQENKTQIDKKQIEEAKEYMYMILKYFKLDDIQLNEKIEKNRVYLIIKGERLGQIIGKKATTLSAIQYLLNLTVNDKKERSIHFVLDNEEYRKQREQILMQKIKTAVDQVKKQNKKTILYDMSPYDRRVTHVIVEKMENIKSRSCGQGPNRRVIIYKKEHEKDVFDYIKANNERNKLRKEKYRKPQYKQNKNTTKEQPSNNNNKMKSTYNFEQEFLKNNEKAKLYGKIDTNKQTD